MVRLLPIKIMQNERLWRTLLLALCVLTFMFALHAKTAVYNGDAPAKVTPSTASKLWLSGQKMEVRSADPGDQVAFLDGYPLSVVWGVFAAGTPRARRICPSPPPEISHCGIFVVFSGPRPFKPKLPALIVPGFDPDPIEQLTLNGI